MWNAMQTTGRNGKESPSQVQPIRQKKSFKQQQELLLCNRGKRSAL
jgi:hypothetical protein